MLNISFQIPPLHDVVFKWRQSALPTIVEWTKIHENYRERYWVC